MKIAVFGYYNALNVGDDRIQVSITRLLQGHTVVFLPHYLSPPLEYLRLFDWILIGGGGLVFERVGIWENPKQWLRHCRAKIGVLGLGVNRVSSELLEDITVLIEHSEFFYVRDQQSKVLLNHHPKVSVYSDLTWCFPLQEEDVDVSGQGIALNLLPCHWKTFDTDAWVNVLSGFQILPFPFHFGKGRDADLLRSYFGDRTPQEFSLQPLLKSNILVACRFHAIVFAMQLGKPFIAINYDDKVKRLLADADLTEYCLETTDYELLQEKIQFVIESQVFLKQKIFNFTQQQQEISQRLTQSIQSHLLNKTIKPTYVSSLKISVKKLLQRR